MGSVCELVDDLRNDLIVAGFKSSLTVKPVSAHTTSGFITSLDVSNRREQLKFAATGFGSVKEYATLLGDALRLVESGLLEPGETFQVGSDDPYANLVDAFRFGDAGEPEGYWVDVLDALHQGWGFGDNVTKSGVGDEAYRHVTFRRMRWGEHFVNTVFPVLARSTADFDVLIHGLKVKAFTAYAEHPNEVVYCDIHGNVRVDKLLTKTIMG